MYEIITYTHKALKPAAGAGPCRIEKGFIPAMDIICDTCAAFGFIFIYTSSKRSTTVVPGAIVEPAKLGNHLIGHAIDGNLMEVKTGAYFNSKKMQDFTGPDQNVIDAIVAKGVRWGGYFKKGDAVHFDDNTNNLNPALWQKMYAAVGSK